MGVYTQLAKLGVRTWNARQWLGVAFIAFLTLGIPAFVMAAASSIDSRLALAVSGDGSPWDVVIGGFGVLGLAFVGTRLARLLRSRRDGAWRQKLRQLLENVPIQRAAALPADATEDMRIRGRVQIEPGDSAVRVRVVDESGRVFLRVAPGVRVFRDDDTAEELYSLEDGDEVDIVGRGRRRVAGRDDYREVDQELELEPVDAAPLHVWVRRRR